MKKELLTPEDIRLLSHNPLLRGFSENDCKKLLTALRAAVRSYPKNTEILSAGSPATQIGIVLEGSAQVISSDVFGNQTIFGMIEPPDLFAEAFCCAGSPAIPVSVLAVRPTRVLFLTYPGAPTPNQSPADASLHMKLMENMVRVLASKNLMLNEKLRCLSRRSTREKLLAYLSSRARAASSLTFSIPFNRQELSDYLCVDRSAMSAELSRLRQEGILDFDRSQFRLHADWTEE